MFFISTFSIYPACRSPLFRFVDFFVSIWFPKAFDLFTFPVFVSLNRLAAPLLVFIFGIMLLLKNLWSILFWGNNHNHISTIKFWLSFNDTKIFNFFSDPIQHLNTRVCICDFPASKDNAYPNFVATF